VLVPGRLVEGRAWLVEGRWVGTGAGVAVVGSLSTLL